jgi:hypothetical protein
MPDNTNVNNNAAVVVIGRTAPVPAGQQKSEKSIPVVIANDQSVIPVEEQNKIQSEVALSLLGIPRSEVALGIFADVNTYDVNPTEWSSTPEQFTSVSNTAGAYVGIAQTMGWGLSHVPEESGAMIEAPADKSAVLTSKRFFRYQPGRVSAATFGVKTTKLPSSVTGIVVQNPCVRKYGIFDNFDGYYWETRNNGEGDNFCVVRRTQSLIYENSLPFGNGAGQQTEDYGRTNPQDPFGKRGSESESNATAILNPAGVTKKFGDLVILRDNLLMTHAAVYDPSLLQPEYKVGITTVSGGNTINIPDVVKSVSNATYDINSGLMVITTSASHGFNIGKYITLSGIGMTCYLDPSVPKIYPNRNIGYNVLQINSPTQFVVNIGVSTVPTFYVSGGTAIGLSTGQYVSYSKGNSVGIITGFADTAIYKVAGITTTGVLTLTDLSGSAVTGLTNGVYTGVGHEIITPVPFIQPLSGQIAGKTRYTTIVPNGTSSTNPNSVGSGMFPYLYKNADGDVEGYIDTTLPTSNSVGIATQISAVNDYYNKWVNQNVAKEYWNVYEYRIPRSRFSGDRLDNLTDDLLYSDVVSDKRAGQFVKDPDTGENVEDTSIWNLDFTKVTMYKIEFSWYGAVGALFLAYVPVSNGEARWVRVHHLRASNQLKVSSLGNATLPITYLVYGGGNQNRNGVANNLRPQSTFSYGSGSEHIVKYGASYYIDGGDRGTVKLFSYSTPTNIEVYGSKRTVAVGGGSAQVSLSNATNATDPYITAGATSGITSSFYVGSKVITTDPLDQNIEINYVNTTNRRLYLNSPLNSTTLSNITIITDRKTPLIGLKCRDFIQSSTGRDVRNRTQVYPTRLSTGSTGVIKVDLLKTPIFQTTSIVTASTVSLNSGVNIGKSGKPTGVSIPLVVYTGAHTFVSATAGGITKSGGGTLTVLDATYTGSTGILSITTASHGLSNGNTVTIANNSLTFRCSLDNYATLHTYPRSTDPISGITTAITLVDTTRFTVNVGQAQAEYIRDIGTGTYGYFRGYFENDPTKRPFSVLGYLENKGFDRTKGIQNDGYYFYALNSTSDNIVLRTDEPFLREENTTAKGDLVTSTTSEFVLQQLSSIKVNPQIRSPIPKTGTVVASLYIPASGENYDLSPYFDYNKEYLSFPLTNVIESLYLCGSSQSPYDANAAVADVSASLTWEEQ